MSNLNPLFTPNPLSLGIFIAPKCVKSQNQLHFHTIELLYFWEINCDLWIPLPIWNEWDFLARQQYRRNRASSETLVSCWMMYKCFFLQNRYKHKQKYKHKKNTFDTSCYFGIGYISTQRAAVDPPSQL